MINLLHRNHHYVRFPETSESELGKHVERRLSCNALVVAQRGDPGLGLRVGEDANLAVLPRPTITCANSPFVFKRQPSRKVSWHIISFEPNQLTNDGYIEVIHS